MATPSLSRRAFAAGGQPIGALMHKALSRPELISLAAGFVDQSSLPVEAVGEAWRAVAAEPSAAHAALQYGTTAGYRPLRELLLAAQRRRDGEPAAWTDVAPEQVLVTSGSNQLLYLLTETLCDPGDIVLCVAPTYFVYLGMLRNLGVRGIGIPADDDGLDPAALDRCLQQLSDAGELHRVKAAYVVSYFDNPSGTTLAAARRPAIVEIVRRWSRERKIYVLEDCAYRELRFAGDDLPSLKAHDTADEHVILTDTFSKSFSPGVRVGWAFLPRELVGPLHDVKGNIDFGAPNWNQHVMYEAVRSGAAAAQAEKLRSVYRTKRDAMLTALDAHFGDVPEARWKRPDGGLYVWLRLPPGVDAGLESPLFEAALDEGVLYVPGGYSYAEAGAPAARNTMRLSFGVQTPARIAEGIRLLAAAFRKVAR